ncbi:MAG TPA: molybdopterin-dependent oxidoreductase [Anaerolineales bacterium]|nr:molybdopterin-dependent oxidoreductase [Anaerolineales bacterium]
MITLTIDGQTLSVKPGTTALDAALAHDIDIPRLCHHPELKPSGGCRLCLVEVEGRPNPVPSCGLTVEPGMVVRTQSEQLTALRRDTLDLFISDHPLDCVTCDKAGACALQKYAYDYGLTETTFEKNISRTLYQDDNPFFIRDHKYCILCGKCTRVCDEVVGAHAIEIVDRGFGSHVATPFDGPMIDSSCVFCGSCVQVCPTAALLPVSRLKQGREWELDRKRTICGYCGVGCAIEYRTKGNKIVYAQGYAEAPVNGEFLCTKGRFGWDFAQHPDRLTRPLVRKDLAHQLGLSAEPWALGPTQRATLDDFVPVAWDVALDLVATKLAETVFASGPDSIASLASARCTNEDNYLFQKLMRATIGTNNVDHCARLCHASTVSGLAMAFGGGAMTNAIHEIRDADCLFVTGSNTTESHPVISYEMVRAVKSGANLLLVDPRRIPLAEHATLWLQTKPGTDIYVFLAMAHVILREGWVDQDFVASRTEGFAEFARSVEFVTPELAALESGVPSDKIVQAARMYALGERASGVSKYAGEPRGHSGIFWAMGITQRRNGTEMVLSLANLAMMTGQLSKPSTGVNPLRGQSNVQGCSDMGALPDVLPGYQKVTDAPKRQAVAEKWGLADLPAEPGLTVTEIMAAAHDRRVRSMYIMGENPMLSDPNLEHVEESLRKLDFLAVQEIFLSETAQLAHVVLPASSWLEKDGTKTNTERRVQSLHPVLKTPGDSKPDWWIVAELGKRLEGLLERVNQRRRTVDEDPAASGSRPAVRRHWGYSSPAQITDEITTVSPAYRGIVHRRLGDQGLVWPCPSEDHPGTAILHATTFTRGLGKFHAVTAKPPVEQPDAEYPLVLSTGRVIYHYHTGTMSRRSAPLHWRDPRDWVEINAVDAQAAGIADASPVVIRSRRGEVKTQARISEHVPPGVIFLAFHWAEAPANLLTQDHTVDPYAKIPEFKLCTVRVEAVN